MSYPFDDHDDDLSEFYQFQNIEHFCLLWTLSNITSLHYLLYFFAENDIYNREFLEVFLIRKRLFNSEKPKRTDPMVNYFDACV